MNCQEVEELAGAYALRALPADALQEVEEHLASCAAHPDMAALQATALTLIAAAPEMEPPPGLRTRLMEAVRRDTAAEAREASAARRRWSWPRFSPYALAGALAVAVAALLAWNVLLQVSSDGDGEATFVRTLTDGGAARGRILYDTEQKMALMTVQSLEPLPPDQTYQVWAISAGKPTGIGVFNTSESGEASEVMAVDLSDAEIVAVTIEPAGGSPQPTTEPILTAKM